MKKRLLIAIIPAAVLLAGPWVVPCLVPWSPINCHDQEINIKTGQARYSRYLWYIKISERIEGTILSKVLDGEVVDVADIAPWHMVNRFSPGLNHSPHYKLHGALPQAHEVELLFKILEPDAQRKGQIVRDLLKLWQTTGSYFEADRYLVTLSEEANTALEKQHPGVSPKPNPATANEEDNLSDPKYQQALQCYTLLHEQPEPEACWGRLVEKERTRTLSEAEAQLVEKLRSFARAFDWELKETPDAVVADRDQKEVEAIVTRICGDPKLKLAYMLPDADSWDRLTAHFFHGNRCYVEMFFHEGYAHYVNLFKHQGRWEVLLTGYWLE